MASSGCASWRQQAIAKTPTRPQPSEHLGRTVDPDAAGWGRRRSAGGTPAASAARWVPPAVADIPAPSRARSIRASASRPPCATAPARRFCRRGAAAPYRCRTEPRPAGPCYRRVQKISAERASGPTRQVSVPLAALHRLQKRRRQRVRCPPCSLQQVSDPQRTVDLHVLRQPHAQCAVICSRLRPARRAEPGKPACR